MLWQQSSFWTIRKPYKPSLRIPTILDRNLSVRQPVWLPNGLDFEWCMAYLCIFGLVFEQCFKNWNPYMLGISLTNCASRCAVDRLECLNV